LFLHEIIYAKFDFIFFCFLVIWVAQAPPPPPLRSSPERDGVIDFVAVDPKSMVIDAETVGGPALSVFIISVSLSLSL
jgi:hypothetical protein